MLKFDQIITRSRLSGVRFVNQQQTLNHYGAILGPFEVMIYVGANNGQELPHSGQWAKKIYAFEAASVDSVWLPLCSQADEQITCINVALAEANESRQFWPASNNWESSSLFQPGSHLTEFSHVGFGEPSLVECRRLDSFEFAADCEVLIMDVQGAEYNVLRGISNFSSLQLILLEFTSPGLYHSGSTFADCEQLLTSQGFAFVEVINLYHNSNSGAYAGDAVFVKQNLLEKIV